MRPQRTPVPVSVPDEPTPFGVEFQAAFLKLLLADQFFSRALIPHVKSHFFQNEVMSWVWASCLKYHESYGHLPSWTYLIDAARKLDAGLQQLYLSVVHQVQHVPLTDEVYLRDASIEYVKRVIFRQAYMDSRDLYAANKFVEAYDLMQERLDQIRTASVEGVDRGWYAEEFALRQAARASTSRTNLISTGIAQLDKILEGGAYPGFLGTWIAYPKRGKSTVLVNHGIVAMRAHFARVLHVVLEGSREMVEARYDSAISRDLYVNVKRGDMDAKLYESASKEMMYLRSKLVIRGFTEDWETNILHIDNEMKDLKKQFGWSPELIIVDYADLMRSRTPQATETLTQTMAYKDLKALANRGHRIWTASQAQRPRDAKWDEDSEHLLTSKDIADAYAKVRVCDFVGSLNSSASMRDQGIVRIFPEMFRDGPAGAAFDIGFDFSRMTYIDVKMGQNVGSLSGAVAAQKPFLPQQPAPFAYGWKQQNNGV